MNFHKLNSLWKHRIIDTEYQDEKEPSNLIEESGTLIYYVYR